MARIRLISLIVYFFSGIDLIANEEEESIDAKKSAPLPVVSTSKHSEQGPSSIINIDALRKVFSYLSPDEYKKASLVNKRWLHAARHQNQAGLFAYRVKLAPEEIPYGKLLPISRLCYFVKEVQFIVSSLPHILSKFKGIEEILLCDSVAANMAQIELPIKVTFYPQTLLPVYSLLPNITPPRLQLLNGQIADFVPAQLTELKDILSKLDRNSRWQIFEGAEFVIQERHSNAERLQIIKSFQNVDPGQMQALLISLENLGKGLKGISTSRLIKYITEKGAERLSEISSDAGKLIRGHMRVSARIEILDQLIGMTEEERKEKVMKTLKTSGGRPVSPRFVVANLMK